MLERYEEQSLSSVVHNKARARADLDKEGGDLTPLKKQRGPTTPFSMKKMKKSGFPASLSMEKNKIPQRSLEFWVHALDPYVTAEFSSILWWSRV